MPAERRRSGRNTLPAATSAAPAPTQPSPAASTPAASSSTATQAAQNDRLRSILSPPKAPGDLSPTAGRKLQFNEAVEARTFATGDTAAASKQSPRRQSLPSPAGKRKKEDEPAEEVEPSSARPAQAAGQLTAAPAAAAPAQEAAPSPAAQAPRKKKAKVNESSSEPSVKLPPALGNKNLQLAALPTPPPSELSHPSSSSLARQAPAQLSASPPSLPTPSVSAGSDQATDDKAVSAPAGGQPVAAGVFGGESDDDLSSIGSASDDDRGVGSKSKRAGGGRSKKAKVPRARFYAPRASFVKRVPLPEAVGPAAEKVYLVEGLFTNRSVDTRFPGFPNGIDKTGQPAPYKPSALAAVLNDMAADDDVKPVVAVDKPAKAKPSKAWVTILPDGTQVEGRLPRHSEAASTPQPEEPEPAAPKKPAGRKGRYVWVTELPDGTTVDGRLPILKDDDDEDAEMPAVEQGEEAEVEDAILATAETEESEQQPAAGRTTRLRAGRTSLPAPVTQPPADLTFEPLFRRSARASLPGPSASGSPAPSDVVEAAPKRRGGKAVESPVNPALQDTPFVFPLPNTFKGVPDPLIESRPFQLSYDIIWEWERGGLDSQKKPKPFKTIPKNAFPYRGRDFATASICDCKPPPEGSDEMGCGDTCINRALQYLCSPRSCPCRERCSNKSLYNRETPSLKVFWTGSRGFGLKAMDFIPKGVFVLDYRGEVITLAEYYSRIQTVYKGRHDYYALEYGEGEVLDSGMKGNIARFINHGCSPNLRVHKYTTLGEGVEEYEVGFWSTRNIEPGEELFYDYNFDSFATRTAAAAMTNAPLPLVPAKPAAQKGKKGKLAAPEPEVEEEDGNGRQRCNCGADACTGWIGGAKKGASQRKASAAAAAAAAASAASAAAPA